LIAVAAEAADVAAAYSVDYYWRLFASGYYDCFCPQEIIGIAYDSGGVTTSTITVTLVTALGVGLASSIKGRNPMIGGFGLIALASLTPMICMMAYGMII
jgi:hypothetical protein